MTDWLARALNTAPDDFETFGTFGSFGHSGKTADEIHEEAAIEAEKLEFPRETPAPVVFEVIAKSAGTPAEWIEGWLSLDPSEPPCPSFRKWPAVHRAGRSFLDSDLAANAADLGWSIRELFGVHRTVGTVRVDCSGALTLNGGSPVVTVGVDGIVYANDLQFRRRRGKSWAEVVPIWEFGR